MAGIDYELEKQIADKVEALSRKVDSLVMCGAIERNCVRACEGQCLYPKQCEHKRTAPNDCVNRPVEAKGKDHG